jgi:hypothetical protein
MRSLWIVCAEKVMDDPEMVGMATLLIRTIRELKPPR